MMFFTKMLRYCLLMFCVCFTLLARAEVADQLFQQYSDSIVQIRVVDKSSDSKSSIGSGFLVRDTSTLATNYHVISALVEKPDQYYLEAVYKDLTYTGIEVVNVDVVNDLAILHWPEGFGDPLAYAQQEPLQGASIFAFGNPRDIGLTVVPGTYNGMNPENFYHRIHLTASINPGMSGGPALNTQGEVVGINVATSGNQISFLVPVSKLEALLVNTQLNVDLRTKIDLNARIEEQLIESQQRMYRSILRSDWAVDELGRGKIFARMVPFVRCWGDSENSGGPGVRIIDKGCHSENYIYLGRSFTTGFFEYEFSYRSDFGAKGSALDSLKFYRHLQQDISNARPGNRATKGDVTGYQCKTDTVRHTPVGGSETLSQTHFCLRQYKDFPRLFDVLYIASTIDRDNEALVSHFTLSGVEQEFALTFVEKFMEGVGWK